MFLTVPFCLNQFSKHFSFRGPQGSSTAVVVYKQWFATWGSQTFEGTNNAFTGVAKDDLLIRLYYSSLCLALADLELTLWIKLTSNS